MYLGEVKMSIRILLLLLSKAADFLSSGFGAALGV